MKSNPSREPAVATEYNAPPKSPSGSQTLFRGLDLLDVVAQTGTIGLPALAAQLGLTRSTRLNFNGQESATAKHTKNVTRPA